METLPANWDSACGYCSAPLIAKGSFCGRCRAIKYCDIDCQREHWREHCLECDRMRSLRQAQRPEVPATYLHRLPSFPEDTQGLLSMVFPCLDVSGNRFNFTRRTADDETLRKFAFAGMRLWRRSGWIATLEKIAISPG